MIELTNRKLQAILGLALALKRKRAKFCTVKDIIDNAPNMAENWLYGALVSLCKEEKYINRGHTLNIAKGKTENCYSVTESGKDFLLMHIRQMQDDSLELLREYHEKVNSNI